MLLLMKSTIAKNTRFKIQISRASYHFQVRFHKRIMLRNNSNIKVRPHFNLKRNVLRSGVIVHHETGFSNTASGIRDSPFYQLFKKKRL